VQALTDGAAELDEWAVRFSNDVLSVLIGFSALLPRAVEFETHRDRFDYLKGPLFAAIKIQQASMNRFSRT
jgi:hypothetical protein